MYIEGPRGREVRPVERSVRYSEVGGVKDEANKVIADTITKWRNSIIDEYTETLTEFETVDEMMAVPVPRVDELQEMLIDELREVYEKGIKAVERELERQEKDPSLTVEIEEQEVVPEMRGDKIKLNDDAEQSQPAEPDERRTGSRKNQPGSATASGKAKIEVSKSTEKALQNKIAEHNEKHGDAKSKRVTLSMLKAVYRRGAGAFSVSHRPGMTRGQWAMARVNAFLRLVRTGRPGDSKYITDNDLLPAGHPRKSEAKKNG